MESEVRTAQPREEKEVQDLLMLTTREREGLTCCSLVSITNRPKILWYQDGSRMAGIVVYNSDYRDRRRVRLGGGGGSACV